MDLREQLYNEVAHHCEHFLQLTKYELFYFIMIMVSLCVTQYLTLLMVFLRISKAPLPYASRQLLSLHNQFRPKAITQQPLHQSKSLIPKHQHVISKSPTRPQQDRYTHIYHKRTCHNTHPTVQEQPTSTLVITNYS